MLKFQEMLKMRIVASLGSKSFCNSFKTLESDEERVAFTFNVLHKFNTIPEVQDVEKSAKDAEKFREEGNKLFVTCPLDGHKCIKVLKLYTKSIAYAPCHSKELALAYANRSAVLLKIHKYVECIEDIDRALSLNYPDNLRAKLYVRKVECLVSIGQSSLEDSYETAMHWVEKMSLDDPNREKLKMKLDWLQGQSNNRTKNNMQMQDKSPLSPILFPPIKTPNIEVPCALDAVAIKYDDYYERHVVAVRDIEPGEVIAIEQPYSLFLIPDNIYSHCSNCLNVSWANIPCDYCTYSMYCSEKCKSEEWKKYHDIECPIFSELFKISNYPKLDLFSIRLTIQAIREFNSIEKLREEVKEVDECHDPRIKGFSSDKKFYSNKYRSLYSLATNVSKRGVVNLFTTAIDACFISYLLAKRTLMFGSKLKGDLSVLAKNRDVTFVGGLILRHQQLISTNVHSFTEEYGLDGRDRGVAAMPFCSLISHSCNPNVIRHSRSTDVVLYAIYPIKKGEQILDNYSQHYGLATKEERQQYLLQQYYFLCKCIPCEENWPLYLDQPSFKDKVKNERCRLIITSVLTKYSEYRRIATEGNVFDKPHITKDLFKMILVLYKNVSMPCREIADTVEVVKRVVDLFGNRYDIPVL